MNPFDPVGFWIKSVLFINRALGTRPTSEDERRIWASLALELLAKWALAETSPTLVADPLTGKGVQMYKALGLRAGDDNVSVAASTAFTRCAELYKPFNANKALEYSAARNDYLHGAGLNLMKLPNHAWWSGYWALVQILLVANGKNMQQLVGPVRIREVDQSLALNKKMIEDQVTAAIEAAKQNLEQSRNNSFSAAQAYKWSRFRPRSLEYESTGTCPACGNIGTVSAELFDESEVHWPDPENYHEVPIPVREVLFTPDLFQCPVCHLVLWTYEEIKQADPGLADQCSIEVEAEVDDYEPDYGND